MKPIRKIRTLSTGTFAVLLLACCSQSDSLPGNDIGSRPALLQLHSLQASGITGAATRTVTTTAYPTDRLTGFFVKADEPNKYAACDNYKGAYDVSAARWLPVPDILLNKNNADIAVYVPYDPAQTVSAALSLAACLRPADGSGDIWCKRFTANNQSADIPALTLEHVYTRLSLSVSRSADYKEDATLTGISLTGNEIYAGSTYRFFDAAPYAYDGSRGFSAVSTRTLNDASPTAAYDLLLIPTAALTKDLTLALTVNGRKMRVVIAKEKFAGTAGKLEAGKQYNIGLTLVPGKLEIVSVAIVKWNTPAEVNGGDAEYEPDTPLAPGGNINVGGYEPDPDGGNMTNDTPEQI